MNKFIQCLTTSLISLSFALPVFASVDYKDEIVTHTPSWLYLGVYGGYGNVSGAYDDDGQFTQGRLALGGHITRYQRFFFGAETGVQWGNEMRLSADDEIIDEAGGLPIQATLKPLIDLLLTVQAQIVANYPLYGVLKGGIAYRQLQFMDRTSEQDNLRKVNGELQVGLAYNLTEHATLTIFYQGIYSGKNADISLDNDGGLLLGRIPTQQAGFLGVEYSI